MIPLVIAFGFLFLAYAAYQVYQGLSR